VQIIWNDEQGGNVEHIEEHGLTVEDVEHVLQNRKSRATSNSYPVTAYDVPEP
jgi:hypothetical protein